MRTGRVVLAGMAMLALGGCARPGDSAGAGTGDTGLNLSDAGVSCAATGPGDPFSSAPPTAQITADFVPVTVTRCLFRIAPLPGDGEWTIRLEQSAAGDLSGLLTELRNPPAGRGTGACPATTLEGAQAAAFVAAMNAVAPVTAACRGPQVPSRSSSRAANPAC